ncbi:Hsp20/alpha crystallin family protein [Paenibacillus beijingensis]|uniref:SHSP domain-containing protein n=1 Tax=Paenibacillus beijingensis TaxID=1126833 RepID=A0A0D5NQW8_9BACL|nr:Hsp20/alpha crystallin family protein [Paenibacillus beijingensis]AJY77293.1 hypothetical protein VN24_25450 [Paenibacillus beijingensis]
MGSKWEDMQSWLAKQQLPKGFDMMKEADWVGRLVRQMMTSAMEGQRQNEGGQSRAEFVETQRHLLVKIALPQAAAPDSLRLLVREDRLKITGLPGQEEERIKLPKPVIPRACQAAYRNGILKVKLRKRPFNRSYLETAIRYE